MAIRNRSTTTSYVNEVNTDGVATQKELNDSFTNHINTLHENEIKNKTIDGIEYFWDGTRYLSKQYFVVDFCDQDTTTKNIYLFQKKNIRCNYSYYTLPFGKDMLIDKVQVSLDANKSGNLFDIETNVNNVIYTISHPYVKYNVTDNVNVVVPAGDPIKIYCKNITVSRPIVTLWIRLIG